MFKNKKLLAIGIGLLSIVIIVLLINMKSPSRTDTKANQCFTLGSDSVSFWVTGDAMMHMPQYNAAMNPETGIPEFDSCYTFIRPILQETDVRIINFETTLAGRKYSGFPRFSAPKVYADALVRAGFNFFVFANNHSCDRGSKGFEGNLNFADSAKIWHTGIFRNQEERKKTYPYIFEVNGLKLAMLNATYGTNSIKAPKPYIVNMIDTNEIKKDIANAKAQNVDAILIAIHWGEEYQHKPNIHQKRIADFLLREGVDVIMGSHPHIVQPIEMRNVKGSGSLQSRLVIWSLGNFISNQKDPYTDAGLMIRFTLKKGLRHRPKITNIQYLPFYRYKNIKKKPGYYLMPSKFTEKHLDELIPNAKDQEDFISVMKNTRGKMPKNKHFSEYSY